MQRRFFIIAILTAWTTTCFAANPADSSDLLKVRETVWRSWFANDADTLRRLVPPETIVISSGETQWKHQPDVLRTAAQFQADGGRLVRLEFPRTKCSALARWRFFTASTRLRPSYTESALLVPAASPRSLCCVMAIGLTPVGTQMRRNSTYSNIHCYALLGLRDGLRNGRFGLAGLFFPCNPAAILSRQLVRSCADKECFGSINHCAIMPLSST